MKTELQEAIDLATSGISLLELAEVIEYLKDAYKDQKAYEKEVADNRDMFYYHDLGDVE